ncbi:MAG TPA: hypothetical protein DEQ39_17715 [Atlantibacter hermannii]|nr:hypothetical protein [Atlantibacter hermannii]
MKGTIAHKIILFKIATNANYYYLIQIPNYSWRVRLSHYFRTYWFLFTGGFSITTKKALDAAQGVCDMVVNVQA